MTDFEHDDFARELLASAKADAPSAHARHRAAAALGLGVTMLTPGAAGAAGMAGAIKWVMGLALVAGLGSGAYVWTSRSEKPTVIAPTNTGPTPPAPAVVEATPPLPTPSTVVTPVPVDVSPPAAATRTLPQRDQRITAATPAAPAAIAPPRDNPDLAAEIAHVDAARSLLSTDARAAQAKADAYRLAYPAGAFLPEAAFVAIDATARLNDDVDLTRRVAAFAKRFPSSPLVARARALVQP